MTTLRLEAMTVLAAELGTKDPLPALKIKKSLMSPEMAGDSVPASARKYLGYGCEDVVLPYRAQNGYGRERQLRPLQTAVLENELLRATFLLEHGGRLWSLVHKPSGRELLYVNPVFQPANLAVRNAWFSGGVEWNCGVRGHTPLTCSPMFAAEVRSDEGWPVLRLWEFERQRAFPYQLDFILPPGSPWLHVRVRIRNPHPVVIPMYWWSNVAVPMAPNLRIVVPATEACSSSYRGGLQWTPVPELAGKDVTYPERASSAADYFFDLPPDQRPWISALDAHGSGLIQTSTMAQRGRKLFVWGQGTGGKQWQRFLTQGDFPYCEIQAGVARTQFECFPLEADSQLVWMESYGLMEANPGAVHGADWKNARTAVESQLAETLPQAQVEKLLVATAELADRAPHAMLQFGSGWGALEEQRRRLAGEPLLGSPAVPFASETLGPTQEPWLKLLETGHFPEADAPDGWMVQAPWHQLLESCADDHWLAWLHRGVMRYHAGDSAGAVTAWEQSLRQRRTAWALRNLAVVAKDNGQTVAAADLWRDAHLAMPELCSLVIECLHAQIDAGRPDAALALVARLPVAVANHGRVKALEALAAVTDGQLDRAESILRGNLVVPDLREGELSLSDVWHEWVAARMAQDTGRPLDDALRQQACQVAPPLPHLDFRMNAP